MSDFFGTSPGHLHPKYERSKVWGDPDGGKVIAHILPQVYTDYQPRRPGSIQDLSLLEALEAIMAMQPGLCGLCSGKGTTANMESPTGRATCPRCGGSGTEP